MQSLAHKKKLARPPAPIRKNRQASGGQTLPKVGELLPDVKHQADGRYEAHFPLQREHGYSQTQIERGNARKRVRAMQRHTQAFVAATAREYPELRRRWQIRTTPVARILRDSGFEGALAHRQRPDFESDFRQEKFERFIENDGRLALRKAETQNKEAAAAKRTAPITTGNLPCLKRPRRYLAKQPKSNQRQTVCRRAWRESPAI